MATSFFARLGEALASAGHEVRRINFCGGDRLFWSLPGRRRLPRLAQGLAAILAPARRMGSHGHHPVRGLPPAPPRSPGHRDAAPESRFMSSKRATAAQLGDVRSRRGERSFVAVARHRLVYRSRRDDAALDRWAPCRQQLRAGPQDVLGLTNLAMSPLYWGYRSSPWHPLWGGRVGCRGLPPRRRAAAHSATRQQVLTAPEDCFLFPLQLDDDFQIHQPLRRRRHALPSSGWSPLSGRSAPPGSRLIVKEHRWTTGWSIGAGRFARSPPPMASPRASTT